MFRFSLQQVLDYRLTQQEQTERIFHQAQGLVETSRHELRDLENEREYISMQKGELTTKQISPNHILLHQSYLEALAQKMSWKKSEIEKLKVEAEKKRRKLIEAMREVEVMKELEKIELKKFNYTEKKNEEKMLSDCAIFQFHREHRA